MEKLQDAIEIPIYRRMLGLAAMDHGIIWRALEADLRYRLTHECMRHEGLNAPSRYFYRSHGYGIKSVLVRLKVYGEHALGGLGLSNLEDSFVHQDINAFEKHLMRRLVNASLDFHLRDSEAPEDQMAILTGRGKLPVIGVRLHTHTSSSTISQLPKKHVC